MKFFLIICIIFSSCNFSNSNQLINQNQLDLTSFNQEYFLLTFWATWCSSCKSDLSSLAELEKIFPNKLKVLAVAGNNTQQELTEDLKKHKIPITIILDSEQILSKKFKIEQLPTTILVDQSFKQLILLDPEDETFKNKVIGSRNWNTKKVINSLKENLN